MNSLKKQTASGIKWLVGTSFLQKFITLAATVVLARILNPSIFGLFALAFVAIDTLGLFKSLGFDSALIQRKDNIEKAANTAFFVIPALGVILYLILSTFAPLIGKFLNNHDVVGVIRALSIIFLINCFGKVPAALLEKNMEFRKISLIGISASLIYAVSAILFAFFGFGIWSLVIAYLLKTLNENILNFLFSRWRPCWQFDKRIAFEMFHFGKFIFLGAIVWFLKMNLDNILVGKLLGVTALGLYAIAFNIANFGADYFGGRVYRVTYPAYSKLQGDSYDLRRATLTVFKHVSLIALPLGLGVFLLANQFLRFVYGQKWTEATNILKILAWAGIFNTLPAGFGGVFLACGKPKIGFWLTLFQVIIFLVFIVPMSNRFGINGVGIVVVSSGLLVFLIALFMVKKLLSIDSKQILLSLKPALFSSMNMSLGIIIIKYIYYFNSINSSFSFIILLIWAMIFYGFSLFWFDRELIRNLKELLF